MRLKKKKVRLTSHNESEEPSLCPVSFPFIVHLIDALILDSHRSIYQVGCLVVLALNGLTTVESPLSDWPWRLGRSYGGHRYLDIELPDVDGPGECVSDGDKLGCIKKKKRRKLLEISFLLLACLYRKASIRSALGQTPSLLPLEKNDTKMNA